MEVNAEEQRKRDLKLRITDAKKALFKIEELCLTTSQYLKVIFRLLDGVQEDETTGTLG